MIDIEQPISLEDLKNKFKTARELMDNKMVPVDIIEEFADFLTWAEADPVARIYSNNELKKFFFEEFVGGIAKRISQIRELEQQYQPLIKRVVMILCDLFYKELERDNSDMADSIRYMFDVTSTLNQNLFQSEENLNQVHDPSLIDKLPEEEKEWRKALKVGDKIDAIKIDPEYNLKLWAKAEIIRVYNDLIQVVFENDNKASCRNYWWYSPEIDKYNSKSEGDEWRLDIKPGDLIDAFDSTKIWYASTVQDRNVRNEDGREVLYIKVGFRIFHPFGNKEDDDKNKYFGWSDRFDEWIQAYNPRIQKYQTFAKTFEESQSQNTYEETVDDQMDMLLYSKNAGPPVFAVVRRRCRSTLLVSFLNRFGELGGFQKIIERLNLDNNNSLTLETLFYYIDSLSKSTAMYNKAFINEFLPQLEAAVKKKILTASEQNLRKINKDRIDGIVNSLIGTLESRIKNYKQREQDKNIFNLDIGCVFLEQNFLERRIDGAKIIQEVCKNANLSTYTSSQETAYNTSSKNLQMLFVAEIIHKLKQNKVLQQIFSKDRGHLQLVQRSEELLKLLIGQNALSDEELNLVWNSARIDETTKLELYKVFGEIASRMRVGEITFLIEKINQIPVNKIINEEIELVHELGRRSRSPEHCYGQMSVEFMWKIIFSTEQTHYQINAFRISDKVTINQATHALPDIIKNWDNYNKLLYVEKIIEALKNNQEGYLCVKMIVWILKDFAGESLNEPQSVQDPEGQMNVDELSESQRLQKEKFANRSTFIEYVNLNFNLLDVFLENFKHYMFKARSNLRAKLQQEPNVDVKTFADKVLADKFIHSDQMNERLDFLKYLAQNSSLRITQEQMNVLWEELVVHQMFQSDSNLFYRWLKEVCDLQAQNCPIVDLSDLITFFKEQITKETKVFQSISLEGFNCIQSFFILLNESARKIQRFGNWNVGNQQPTQKFTSYSNTTGEEYRSYSFNQNKNNNSNSDEDIEFHILCHPNELEGIDGIWRIAIDCYDSKVTEKANGFLIKLYTSVTFQLEPLISQFEELFIHQCINGINVQRIMINNRVEQPKDEFENVEKPITQFSSIMQSILQKVLPAEERKILKYITLLRELMKNSEKDGTLGVKSHSSLFQGAYLDCLQIQNQVKQGAKYQNKIEIGCYSNTTLWDLRKMIGEQVARVYYEDGTYHQETPCHPATIRLYRYAGCTDLKECDNGKTLAELKFKHNEQLTAFRRNVFNSPRVPLLNIDGTDLSDQSLSIFKSWFYLYSVDDPDNPGKRIMNPQTCVDFTRSCTDDNCNESDSRVTGLFAQYDHDQDEKIQEEDFIEFYRNCCLEKEDVVRQNLFAHNYRFDLKRQPTDGYDDYCMQLRQSMHDMPRYRLSSNALYFDSLFALLEVQGEVATTAWNLIRTISTNPILFKKVLELNNDPNFNWNEIFDSSSIYKMLYVLQIVEGLLDEETHQLSNFDDTHVTKDQQLKHNWIERFLEHGGFQAILELFHKSLEILSQKPVDSLTKFEKNFLEYMLKMIRIFMNSAYSANNQLLTEIIQLVKKTSSYKEKDAVTDADQNVGTNAEQPGEQQQQKTTDAYTTPAKQVKGKFVNNNIQGKKVQFEPEITQDFLFGEELPEKPDPEAIGAASQNEKKTEDTKQSEKESAQKALEETQRFSQLQKIMQKTGLGEVILAKINFKDLQLQILEAISLILAKKEINLEDIQIIENALSLWVSILVMNDTLIDDFFNFTRSDEKAGHFGIKNAEDFIISGIYTYKSPKVREEFSNTISGISNLFKTNGNIKPTIYFLNILKRNFPKEDHYYATRECKHYFELMTTLLEAYLNSLKNSDNTNAYEIDPFELLSEAIMKLKRHESKEKKGSILEDKTLIGYLNIIEKLIVIIGNIDLKKLQCVMQQSNIIHEVFYENLFYNPFISLSKNENKSKTKESRAASYSLLLKIIEAFDPIQLSQFLADNLWPLIKDLERPKKWKYVPSDNTKSSQYVGLINLGCICYMNSMLQQFFMVPQFRYQLLKAEDSSAQDIKEYKGRKVDDNLLKQLQIMYANLELSEKQAFDPFEFCYAFKDIEGNPTNTALQQDAQEFLNIFFDRLEQLLKPTSQKHLLDGVFGGKVCSQLICQSCGNIRNILESFYNLSVPVKDRKGLDDSLAKMIEGGLINDYFCEACKQRVDVEKRSLIAETPNVLIVHLQRIIFNFDTFQNDKINTRFEFPNVLNLKDYSFKSVMQKENRPLSSMEEEHIKHLMEVEDSEYIYKLVGVTIHVGTAEHGHYYSLINTKRGAEEANENKPEWMQTEKDSWKEFNDETVKYYSFNDVKTDSFGGYSGGNLADNEMNAYLVHSGTAQSYGKNAYMLVYEKQKKKPLKEVVTQQESVINENQSTMETTNDSRSASLECANTATSRAADGDQLSALKEVPYRQVLPYVPDWIKNQVIQDNNIFLVDRHIYSESFFNLLKGLFRFIANKMLLTQHHYSLEYIPIFDKIKRCTMEIAQKSMFDLLSYYYYNTQMNDIMSSFTSIIQFCDSTYTLSKGDDSMILDFLQKGYLNDDCYHFFKIMFDCSDKTSRYYIGKLTSTLINKAYQIYNDSEDKTKPRLIELKEAIDNLTIKLVNILSTAECQKNWAKLDQYLKMIHDIGAGGPQQTHLFLTKFDSVVLLIDFMLGNRSPLAQSKGEKRPNMGAGGITPPFEPLVSLLCFLLRFSLTQPMIDNMHTWNELNPPPATLLGFNLSTDQGINKYPLSSMGYQFFTSTGFIDLILKEGIQCEDLGKALAHFCYYDERFSKNLCKLLLHGISRNDYEKVKNYLDVVTHVALIRDEYQRKRLEWIFGYGSLIANQSYSNNPDENREIRTKVGVKVLQAINDEAYLYRSSLINDSFDDALLHLLWRYKGRMDAYTVNCLYSLLNLISADENIAEYFSELPGPTYCLSRYTDWIKPYLNEQLIDARKGYAGSFSAQKEEIVVKCLSLYEVYEQYLNKKDGVQRNQQPETVEKREVKIEDVRMKEEGEAEEENVKNLIEYSSGKNENIAQYQATLDEEVIKCTPQPYIIVDVAEEKLVKENNFDGVELQIIQLSCYHTVSKPTGNNNLAFPYNMYKRGQIVGYTSLRNNNTGTNGQSKEQEMQAQYIQNYFQSSRIQEKYKDKENSQPHDTNYQSDQVHHEDEEQDNQERFAGNVKVQDGNDQWTKVNRMNVSDIDEDDGYQYNEYEGNPHQEGYQEIPNQQNLQDEPQQQVFKIKVIEEGQEVDSSNYNMNQQQFDDNNMNDQINAGDNYENQNSNDINIDPIAVQWPYQVDYCADLVYKIQVTNYRETPAKCTIIISEPDGVKSNLFYPKGGIKGMVYGKQTKSLILLHKLVPDNENCNEIDNLNIEFYWKDKVQRDNYNQNSNQNVAVYPMPPQNNQTQANFGFKTDGDNDLDTAVINDNQPQGQGNQGVQDNDMNDMTDLNVGGNEEFKQCQACTLFNPITNIICECCESQL